MQPESAHPHHRPLLALGLRLAAAFVLAALLACDKLASDKGIHLAEIMFWRQLPTIPILFGWFALRGRRDVLATRCTGSHLRRSGFGLVGNIIVGIVGAVLGGVIFGALGISFGGILGSILGAFLGACILLFLISLVKRA